MRLLKAFISIIIALCYATNVFAANAKVEVEITNPTKLLLDNQPVVIPLNQLCMFKATKAIVTIDGKEIPSQIDFLTGTAEGGELCFLVNLAKKQKITASILLSDEEKQNTYEPQVYTEMMLANKKIKETNKQDLYISSLTVENGVNPYWQLHHHGAAFENNLVAYRIYFDHRQTIDIYGKYNKGMEIKATQWYPDAEQLAAGSGDDVLWVGNTLGLGTFRGWDGKAPTMLSDVEHRTQKILARGPLRTVVEVTDEGWTPNKGESPVNAHLIYTLYANHRDCQIDVRFNQATADRRFSTGIINVKDSKEFTDNEGLRGCWGTDWPVSAKDSVGHKRETVGLGICLNKKNIVSEEPANKDNYAFVVAPGEDNELFTPSAMTYHITYTSDNESFGYHTDKDWFNHLKEWKKTLQARKEVTIKVTPLSR